MSENGDVSMMDTQNEIEDDGLDHVLIARNGAMNTRHIPGSSDGIWAASYELTNEDHTLGNFARWMIQQNPHVEFAAYSIPHPSEPKMNLRIQMERPEDENNYDPAEYPSAMDAFKKCFDDAVEMLDAIMEKFNEEREKAGQTA